MWISYAWGLMLVELAQKDKHVDSNEPSDERSEYVRWALLLSVSLVMQNVYGFDTGQTGLALASLTFVGNFLSFLLSICSNLTCPFLSFVLFATASALVSLHS
jgi:hypothetical protein